MTEREDLLEAEIERLTPYVAAFRREEARADKLGREVDELRAAQPEYLDGCLHPGHCQRLGMCQSQSCKHAGKVIVKRVCVEPKEDGILYPKVET